MKLPVPLGARRHSVRSGGGVRLRCVRSGRCLVRRPFSLLEIGDGGVQLRRQLRNALLGVGDHGVLRRSGARRASCRLRRVRRGGLRSGQRSTQGVDLLLRLLAGLLRGVGGLLGGVVLGDFGLELLLGVLDLVVEVLN